MPFLLTTIYSACPVGSRLQHTSLKFMFFEIKSSHYNMCGMVEHFGIEAADFKMSRFVRSFCLLKTKEDMIFKVHNDLVLQIYKENSELPLLNSN